MVVTDPGGKEPMVVLPLEVYEALVEGMVATPTVAAPSPRAEAREPIMVPVRDGSEARETQAPSERISAQTKPESEPDLLAELSIEERFYIEPLEDQRNS